MCHEYVADLALTKTTNTRVLVGLFYIWPRHHNNIIVKIILKCIKMRNLIFELLVKA
jgi:hypothetical protein